MISEAPADTIHYDYTTFPTDSQLSLKVLREGEFHHDEVWEDAGKMAWMGLFRGDAGYYLSATQIRTKRVNDAILDNENEKTGWQVTAQHEDSCLLLVEALPYLSERTVPSASLPSDIILPGDTLHLSFLGKDYYIFATGGKEKVDDSDWYNVWNYKLYIETNAKANSRSLLVAQPNFDDAMIMLLFAGDIDGDGILDLIIDTSRHYNMEQPTLYLSGHVPEREVVIPAGSHRREG